MIASQHRYAVAVPLYTLPCGFFFNVEALILKLSTHNYMVLDRNFSVMSNIESLWNILSNNIKNKKFQQ
jgi:hypothetical protein